jgi:hypothetical protein
LKLLSLPGARVGLHAPFSRQGPGKMVILPLAKEQDPDVVSEVLAPALAKPIQIEAVQIERDGSVEFLAADRFHHQCVSVGPAVTEALLANLARRGIIRKYYRASEVTRRAGIVDGDI